MNKIFYFLGIVVLPFFMQACSSGDDGDNLGGKADGKRGVLTVTVPNPSVGEETEKITSVRFIVYDDATTSPKIDINELKYVTPKDGASLVANLVVKQNSDKAVVVIVNEPGVLSASLASISNLSQCEEVEFMLADFLTNNNTVLGASGIPMTGIYKNLSIDENDTESSPKNISIPVERSIARVDIYMQRDPADITSATLTTSTTISLKRAYNKGYLITGIDKTVDYTRIFGKAAPTIPALALDAPAASMTWAPTGTVTLPSKASNAPLKVVSFYLPERTCALATDKLVLQFDNITIGGIGPRNAEVVLNEIVNKKNGTTQVWNSIDRNNVHELLVTVTGKNTDILAYVSDWNEVGVDVTFPQIDFLTAPRSCDVIYTIETAKMIVKSSEAWVAERFNDVACTQAMSDNWMTLSSYSGPTTVNGTGIVITVPGAISKQNETRYIRLTAGRKTLVVAVNVVQP